MVLDRENPSKAFEIQPTRIQIENHLDDLVVEIIISQTSESLEKMKVVIDFVNKEYGYNLDDYRKMYEDLYKKYIG